MVDVTLVYLTYAVAILGLGLLSTLISRRIKIPNMLLLLIIGIILNYVTTRTSFTFSSLFLTSISILALVMIVFDSASRFKFKQFDELSVKALKLISVFLLFNALILTPITMLMTGFPFNVYYFIATMIFTTAMSGTDAAIVLSVFKDIKNKITTFLEIESLLNTPIIVLIPFILLDIVIGLESGAKIDFTQHILPFLAQFVAGIGAGVLVGIIIFKVMRTYYSHELSPLAIIVSALLTYILAGWLGGNGVLAITALGLIFGSIYVKQKMYLLEFSSVFSRALQIFVFVLVGFIITPPLVLDFFIKSSALFMLYTLVRFLAIHVSFMTEFNLKEKIFMSLTMPKGIAVSVIAFTLATSKISAISHLLNYMLVFILYSIIVASVTVKFSRFFIKAAVMKEEPSPEK